MPKKTQFPKRVPLPQTHRKSSKLKTATAAILFLVITPLVIYARCSSDDPIKVEELPMAPAVHQKIFVDPAGEKLNPPVTPPSNSKHDAKKEMKKKS